MKELRQFFHQEFELALRYWECPIWARGSEKELRRLAEQKGFQWRPDRNLLFGGYFVNNSGDCLIPR